MKMIKFFEINYFVNFIASLSFIGMVIYTGIERADREDSFFFVSLFSSAFLVIVVPFNWICYSLHKAYTSSLPLSRKGKIAGIIFYILFSLLMIPEVIGSVDIITNVVTRNTFRDARLFLFALLFWSITITAICLCISYWIVRKRVGMQFVNVISELGNEEAS